MLNVQNSSNNKKYYLGIDIGGSHFAMGIVDFSKKQLIPETVLECPINSNLHATAILNKLLSFIKDGIDKFHFPISGIGISAPGPFDYHNGISMIHGLNKYDALFGVNLKLFLQSKLQGVLESPGHIAFINDADSFVLGETFANKLQGNVVGLTLGTGIGSGFVVNGKLITNSGLVPNDGNIFNLPFKNKTVEDWISTKWFLDTYRDVFGTSVKNVKEIADHVQSSPKAKEIFENYGSNLGQAISAVTSGFSPKTIIIGGSIAKSYHLFKEHFESSLKLTPDIFIANDTSQSAILGAVINLVQSKDTLEVQRKSEQYVMPIHFENQKDMDGYNIYPSFELTSGTIQTGVESLVNALPKQGNIIIDGYMGVPWKGFMEAFSDELAKKGVEHIVRAISSAHKDEHDIETMVTPYLGGDDPVFGKIFPGDLDDFFDEEKLKAIQLEKEVLNIIYGSGASLSGHQGKIIYIDMPKNEIQFYARAGQVSNLGNVIVADKKQQYKRMYFIDWPILNKHKQALLNILDYVVDAQYEDTISWTEGTTLRDGLKQMSSNAFRVRPWFEPGIWGGDWMKRKIKGLPQEVPNYAWSFELIVPENGIVFSNKGTRLEVSFDFLMFYDHKAVLGNAAETFGTDFPIRFDYLDTVNGQNLSLQCHPTLQYIQETFGEKFTQDETYYILDADPEAKVYLGFKEGVEKEAFNEALVKSQTDSKPLPVEDYIQVHSAKKHDLFLIPNGTVHCSGIGNLVLEISSTPYIFTFKMYDWMRLDLDGKPRPLNIERGVANLNFECKGEKVVDEYISKQEIIDRGSDWEIVKLSTHPKHFYEVKRFEFDEEISVELNDQCHILNLVGGSKVQIIANGQSMVVHYAETFVIPANAKKYTIKNLGNEQAKVIQSNVKPEFCGNKF